MAKHNQLGKWGEDLACEYLMTKGYSILERNWRMRRLEVDIIATKGKRIIFVEVKTRSTDAVDPLLSIDRTRINHLVRAANVFIRARDVRLEYQFDLVFIIGDTDSPNPKIEHIPDAFLPPLRTYR